MDNHQWRLSQAYTYAYSYNFNYLSITYTLPIACQSLSVHILCLWHIFYLYFYCVPVSMLYISYTSHLSYLPSEYKTYIFTIISRILSYSLSYTVLYFYLQSYIFHIRYSCMLSSDTFHILYIPMFSIYYTFHIPFSFIYFLYFACSYPFCVLYFILSVYCIHVLFIYYTFI